MPPSKLSLSRIRKYCVLFLTAKVSTEFLQGHNPNLFNTAAFCLHLYFLLYSYFLQFQPCLLLWFFQMQWQTGAATIHNIRRYHCCYYGVSFVLVLASARHYFCKPMSKKEVLYGVKITENLKWEPIFHNSIFHIQS